MPERITKPSAATPARSAIPASGGPVRVGKSGAASKRKIDIGGAGGGHHGGFFHALGEAGANFGKAIEGIGPGLYTTGKTIGQDIGTSAELIAGKTDKRP